MKKLRHYLAGFALVVPSLVGSVASVHAEDNLTGAGSAPTPVLNDGPSEILGGTATAVGDYKTVVGLRIGGGLCTGTLIDKEWVLTAAHCITPSLLGVSTQAQVTAQTKIVFDSVNLLSAGGKTVTAKKTIPHPGFNVNQLGSHDIGLIQLNEPITDRTPTPINLDGAKSPVGIKLTMVGYGISQAGTQMAGKQFVLKDRTTASCSGFSLNDATLLCWSQTDRKGKCEGDSGGPSFATVDGKTLVVGVTSFGTQDCLQFGADTRPEAEKDFLITNLGGIIQCAADGACAAACGKAGLPVDPDCPVCTKDAECGDAKVCVSGTCQPEPFSPGGTGATCVSNTDCASAQCGQVGEDQRCVSACDVNASNCPSGFDCLSVGGGAGACWPAESSGCCSVGTEPQDVAPLVLFVGCVLLFGGRRRGNR